MKIRPVLITVLFCFLNSLNSVGQTYFTKDGEISFYSYTPIEEIEAKNAKAVSVLNFDESTLEFSVLIKGFHFKNALMQTHFNENYMDSDNFPKASFKSSTLDLSGIGLQKDGNYTIPVKGIISIRDQEKEISSEAIFSVLDGQISGTSTFVLSPSDFNIEIPSIVRGKIAEEIQVKVSAIYQRYKKS
ncbi:MAG: YceI family protein [Saprospiraceae bacterium]|nr:YceI family protein [Saprospiraceae bacterium]